MTEEQKQLGLKDILAKVAETPNLRFDPTMISAYQGLGGALTNGGIPGPNVQATPIGIASSQSGIKAITDIYNQTQGMQPPPKPATEPTPKPEKTTEDKFAEQLANEGLTDFDKQRLELEQRAIKRTQETKDFITSLSSQLDASKASMLQGIGEQYNRIIQQTEEANRRYEAVVQTAGIRSGGAKYSPEITSGIYQAAVNEGLQRVADIISKRNEAIASVNSAYDSKKFTLMAEEFDRLNKINNDLDSTLKDIAEEQRKKTQELNVEINKQNNEISIYNAIQETGSSDPSALFAKLGGKVGTDDIKKFLENTKSGIEEEIKLKLSDEQIGNLISAGWTTGNLNGVKTLLKTKTLDEIKPALTDEEYNSLKSALKGIGEKATGDYAQYLQLKQAGEIPETMDYWGYYRNKKVKDIQADTIAGTDLDTKQQEVFNRIVEKYNASEAIKALDRSSNLQQIVANIKRDPANGARQLNLIYAYIKGLDTESAVREGEIDLVKSLNSYSDKFKLAFQKISEGRPVTADVALEIAVGAEDLIASIKKTADRKVATFNAQAKANGIKINNAWTGFRNSVEMSVGEIDAANDSVNEEENAKNTIIQMGNSDSAFQEKVKNYLNGNNPLGRILTYVEILQLLQSQ